MLLTRVSAPASPTLLDTTEGFVDVFALGRFDHGFERPNGRLLTELDPASSLLSIRQCHARSLAMGFSPFLRAIHQVCFRALLKLTPKVLSHLHSNSLGSLPYAPDFFGFSRVFPMKPGIPEHSVKVELTSSADCRSAARDELQTPTFQCGSPDFRIDDSLTNREHRSESLLNECFGLQALVEIRSNVRFLLVVRIPIFVLTFRGEQLIFPVG